MPQRLEHSRPNPRRRWRGAGLFATGLAAGLALAHAGIGLSRPVAANIPSMPALHTNQQYVEEHLRASSLDIDDERAVFAFVVASLPERVKVYPTENYFYFGFVHRGVRYVGNIRLDVSDRDDGHVHFAYFREYTHWQAAEDARYQRLNGKDGVTVERQGPLVYRLGYGGKSVVFELNDLSDAAPPAGLLDPEERYLGPVFDESGIGFFLVYNPRLKIFHYVLDERHGVADHLHETQVSARILIGARTGFAFYADKKRERKILIGVYEGNARTNSYLDGPFDQLPDNFLAGDALRQAILDSEPTLEGQIDRLGNSPDGSDRFYIGPYRHYESEEDLAVFEDCASDEQIPDALYYACFVFEEGSPETASAAQ